MTSALPQARAPEFTPRDWRIVYLDHAIFYEHFWCSLRLLQLKTEEQTIQTDYLIKSYKSEIKILANPG